MTSPDPSAGRSAPAATNTSGVIGVVDGLIGPGGTESPAHVARNIKPRLMQLQCCQHRKYARIEEHWPRRPALVPTLEAKCRTHHIDRTAFLPHGKQEVHVRWQNQAGVGLGIKARECSGGVTAAPVAGAGGKDAGLSLPVSASSRSFAAVDVLFVRPRSASPRSALALRNADKAPQHTITFRFVASAIAAGQHEKPGSVDCVVRHIAGAGSQAGGSGPFSSMMT